MHSKNVTPLQGLKLFIFTQGVALGFYVAALSGLRKKMYTLIDLSELKIMILARRRKEIVL
jgi:hypothetical protein